MVREDEEEELTGSTIMQRLLKQPKRYWVKVGQVLYLPLKKWQRTITNKDRDEYGILNKSAIAEVTKIKEEAYKKLYAEVERNGPKVIYKLAKTRQKKSKDIDRMTS